MNQTLAIGYKEEWSDEVSPIHNIILCVADTKDTHCTVVGGAFQKIYQIEALWLQSWVFVIIRCMNSV